MRNKVESGIAHSCHCEKPLGDVCVSNLVKEKVTP